MSDNTALRNGQDATRINLDQDYEIRYWTKELGVTVEQLREAVKTAGSSTVEKVRAALGKG